VSCRGPLLRALWQQFESLVLRDGVLHRIFHGNDGLALFYQVVMPKTMRRSLLELVHSDAAAHLRLEKTLEQVQRRAWWPEWRLDTKIFLQSCDRCASYHRGPPPKQARLRPMVMGFPGQRWCVDLVGLMPTSNRFNYVFTAIDSFTKFVVAAPIRSKDSQTVARMIVEHIFLQWGIAVQLLNDCGLEFENKVLAEICRILGVKRLRTSGYGPQTNACVERYHRVFNATLAKVILENQRDWPSFVAYVVFAYNASWHSATKFCPFFLMTGRHPHWTVDLLLGEPADSDHTLPEYAQEVRDQLMTAYETVRDNLQTAAVAASDWYTVKRDYETFAWVTRSDYIVPDSLSAVRRSYN